MRFSNAKTWISISTWPCLARICNAMSKNRSLFVVLDIFAAMASLACTTAVATSGMDVSWSPSVSASSGLGASSRSVAFRGGAVSRVPLRVCRRPDDGVELLQNRRQRLSVHASAAEGADDPELSRPAGSGSKKKKVVVAAPKKQRVLLRFLWLEKNIGIALDQVVPGHGTIPLSPYYFWPRKDAWEQLKVKLDSKGWISRKRTIILLNQATDIINLWQQNAAGL